MKKTLVVVAALTLALVGCGTTSEPTSTETKKEDSTVEESTTQSESSFTWTSVTTSEDAAKHAGFSSFGVMDKITIGSNTFTNPTFSYAGGVAQAYYESGAIGLIVRKAGGTRSATLTDLDTSTFAHKWRASYEGIDVNLYGASEDAATVITWTDGTHDYGVTYQGLGGETVEMGSNEIAAIVKGFKAANAATSATTQEEEEQTEQKDDATDAEGEALEDGAGTVDTSADTDQDEQDASQQGLDDESGDNLEQPTSDDGDADGGDYLDEESAVAAAEAANGGTAVSSEKGYSDSHGDVWIVTTQDDEGDSTSYYVDKYGNAYPTSNSEGQDADDQLPDSEDGDDGIVTY